MFRGGGGHRLRAEMKVMGTSPGERRLGQTGLQCCIPSRERTREGKRSTGRIIGESTAL